MKFIFVSPLVVVLVWTVVAVSKSSSSVVMKGRTRGGGHLPPVIAPLGANQQQQMMGTAVANGQQMMGSAAANGQQLLGTAVANGQLMMGATTNGQGQIMGTRHTTTNNNAQHHHHDQFFHPPRMPGAAVAGYSQLMATEGQQQQQYIAPAVLEGKRGSKVIVQPAFQNKNKPPHFGAPLALEEQDQTPLLGSTTSAQQQPVFYYDPSQLTRDATTGQLILPSTVLDSHGRTVDLQALAAAASQNGNQQILVQPPAQGSNSYVSYSSGTNQQNPSIVVKPPPPPLNPPVAGSSYSSGSYSGYNNANYNSGSSSSQQQVPPPPLPHQPPLTVFHHDQFFTNSSQYHILNITYEHPAVHQHGERHKGISLPNTATSIPADQSLIIGTLVVMAFLVGAIVARRRQRNTSSTLCWDPLPNVRDDEVEYSDTAGSLSALGQYSTFDHEDTATSPFAMQQQQHMWKGDLEKFDV